MNILSWQFGGAIVTCFIIDFIIKNIAGLKAISEKDKNFFETFNIQFLILSVFDVPGPYTWIYASLISYLKLIYEKK